MKPSNCNGYNARDTCDTFFATIFSFLFLLFTTPYKGKISYFYYIFIFLYKLKNKVSQVSHNIKPIENTILQIGHFMVHIDF